MPRQRALGQHVLWQSGSFRQRVPLAAGRAGWEWLAGKYGVSLARLRLVETFRSVAGEWVLGVSVSEWTDPQFLATAAPVTDLEEDSFLAFEMDLAGQGGAEG